MQILRKSAVRRVLGATAQTFLPFGARMTRRHLNNYAALDAALEAMPPFAENERIFVLSPHPDDEVLGAGGLIARARAQNLAVQIAWLSSGDGSRTTQISQVLRGKRERTLPEIARFRQGEALCAAQTLGVSPDQTRFLGFPDGGARAILSGNFTANQPFVSPFTGQNRVEIDDAFAPGAPFCREALLETLTRAIAEFAPTLVLTTHAQDTHGDHIAAFEACQTAIARLETPNRPRLLTFLIHRGIWPVPNGFHPDWPIAPPLDLLNGGTKWMNLELSAPEIALKKAALECHRTQLGSTPRYLHAFVRRNEVFGEI